MKTNTTNTTIEERKATFSALLENYAKCTSDRTSEEYATVLTDLATAIAYSVLKKCIDTGYNETLVSIRHELTGDKNTLETIAYCNEHATRLTYNEDGDLIQENINPELNKVMNELTKQSLGDGLDLVHEAVLAIAQETAKQVARGETIDLEKPYEVRRLKRKVYIKMEDTVNGWETIETTPIREIYKAVRRAINVSRAAATDPRNGYSYLEDMATDTETGASETVYRRLPKYADLGGYATDYNGACTLYSVDVETVRDVDTLISNMGLTKKQAQVLSLRQSGYGYKAIATYLGVTQRAVAKTVEAIQKKAIAVGLTPNK